MQGSVSQLTTRAGAHLTMPSPQAFPSLGYSRALVCYPNPTCHIFEATESLDPLSCLPLPFLKPSPPPSFFLDPLWCCWVPLRLPSPLPYSSSSPPQARSSPKASAAVWQLLCCPDTQACFYVVFPESSLRCFASSPAGPAGKKMWQKKNKIKKSENPF